MNTVGKHLRESRGFTLIEIAIVIAIIGLLLLIALPLFSGARVRAYVAEARSLTSEWKTLDWSCLVEKSFNESKCSDATGAKIGWTLPQPSDAWNWAGVVFFCGNFATVSATQAASTCVSNISGNDAVMGIRVPTAAPPPPGLNFDYVLVIKTATGQVFESPADGTTITVSP